MRAWLPCLASQAFFLPLGKKSRHHRGWGGSEIGSAAHRWVDRMMIGRKKPAEIDGGDFVGVVGRNRDIWGR